ncbi:hypothetical protein D3C75_1040690 [compost metagenome]
MLLLCGQMPQVVPRKNRLLYISGKLTVADSRRQIQSGTDVTAEQPEHLFIHIPFPVKTRGSAGSMIPEHSCCIPRMNCGEFRHSSPWCCVAQEEI